MAMIDKWFWEIQGLKHFYLMNLISRPILVTWAVNYSAPFNYKSMRLETKTDFGQMSVFSKYQLYYSLRDIRA